MNAKFTHRSLTQLREIGGWITTHRPASAELTRGRILAAIETLTRMPRIGHSGHRPGTREFLVTGLPYVVVYRDELDDTDELVVLGIFHVAQSR